MCVYLLIRIDCWYCGQIQWISSLSILTIYYCPWKSMSHQNSYFDSFFPDLHIPHTPHPEDCRRTEKRIEQNQIEFKNDNFIIWRYTKLRCWLPHHWTICSTRSNIYLSEWYFRSERLFIKGPRSVTGLLRTFPLPQSISTTRIVINCLVWSIHVQHIHMSFHSLNVRCCRWFHSSLLLLHQFFGVTSTIIQ